MRTQIIKNKDCEFVFKVDIQPEDIKPELENADRKLLVASRIKGFRKGKAPADMVKKIYVSEREEHVIKEIIPKAVDDVIKKNNIRPIRSPEITDLKYDFEKDLSASFTATVEMLPVFELKKYKDFKIKKDIKKISKEDVMKELNNLQERNAKLVDSGKEFADKENYVVIDFQGFMNGVAVKGFSGKGQLIPLSGAFMTEGFIKSITGMKKGENRNAKVKFPDDYFIKSVAGKELEFHVTLKDMKDKILPPLDDELARTMGLKSMEELKLKVEDGLARLEEKKFDGSVREEITDRLIEWNPFQPPKSLVEEEYHCMLENIKSSYNKKDFTEDEEKKLREEYYPMAEKRVRYALISARVQEKENIKVAEEDINKEKERIINEGQYKREEVEDFFRKNLEDLMEQVKSEKIYNYFLEKATIKRKYV